MFSTPEDASKKWCPLVQSEGESRMFDTEGHFVMGRSLGCVGPNCMAWRTLHAEHARTGYEEGASERGYCGLAGRPEFLKLADRLASSRASGAAARDPVHSASA